MDNIKNLLETAARADDSTNLDLVTVMRRGDRRRTVQRAGVTAACAITIVGTVIGAQTMLLSNSPRPAPAAVAVVSTPDGISQSTQATSSAAPTMSADGGSTSASRPIAFSAAQDGFYTAHVAVPHGDRLLFAVVTARADAECGSVDTRVGSTCWHETGSFLSAMLGASTGWVLPSPNGRSVSRNQWSDFVSGGRSDDTIASLVWQVQVGHGQVAAVIPQP